jgi:NhaP-type Na+/H+ or K+/H+ antiporter
MSKVSKSKIAWAAIKFIAQLMIMALLLVVMAKAYREAGIVTASVAGIVYIRLFVSIDDIVGAKRRLREFNERAERQEEHDEHMNQ